MTDAALLNGVTLMAAPLADAAPPPSTLAHAPDGAVAAAHAPAAPLCRHWARTGSCLQGASCRFAHPDGAVLVDAPRRRTWGGRRAAVRNRCRATVFRRHLIDAFGRELLRGGSGVLDVAGGKGEVAFQLLNLNRVRATVVDPRPLRLRQFERRSAAGIYHNTGPYAAYTDVPAEDLSDGMTRAPGHAPLFLDAPLAEALGALAAARRQAARCSSGQGAAGASEEAAGRAGRGADGAGGEDRKGGAHDGAASSVGCADACLAHARALLADSLRRAAAVEWSARGLDEHEDARAVSEAFGVASGGLGGDGSSGGGDESGWTGAAHAHFTGLGTCAVTSSFASTDELGAPRGGCGHAVASSSSGIREGQPPPGGRPWDVAASWQELPRPPTPCGAPPTLAAAEEAQQPGGPAVAELDELIDRLLSCSCIVGLHPDASTEPAVRLALTLGVPWAVVPCCVYSQLAPGRRLPGGAPVRTYDNLIAFIRNLAARHGCDARVAVLPFEGKNVCVWGGGRRE